MPDTNCSRRLAGPWELRSRAEAGAAVSVPGVVFDRLLADAEILEDKLGQPAVLEHADQEGTALVTKIWRARGPFSSDRLIPYSSRFVRAARRLRDLGVPAPRVRFHGRVAGREVRFVTYERLPGRPLRALGDQIDLTTLAGFVLRLHDLGVYFRGLHLGNLIETDEGVLGIIDVADTRFQRRPLSRRQRVRSLGILCSHPLDYPYMQEGHWSELVMAYCSVSGMTLAEAARVRERVRRQVQRRNTRRNVARTRRGRPPLQGVGFPKQE